MFLREWMISNNGLERRGNLLQATDIWILLAHVSKQFESALLFGNGFEPDIVGNQAKRFAQLERFSIYQLGDKIF